MLTKYIINNTSHTADTYHCFSNSSMKIELSSSSPETVQALFGQVPQLTPVCTKFSSSHNSGHEEFIKLILLLFCFAQRPSFPCDTQKQESVVTRLNRKDLINSSAVWDFQINSSANRE